MYEYVCVCLREREREKVILSYENWRPTVLKTAIQTNSLESREELRWKNGSTLGQNSLHIGQPRSTEAFKDEASHIVEVLLYIQSTHLNVNDIF
jgi:hypothetical protein